MKTGTVVKIIDTGEFSPEYVGMYGEVVEDMATMEGGTGSEVEIFDSQDCIQVPDECLVKVMGRYTTEVD